MKGILHQIGFEPTLGNDHVDVGEISHHLGKITNWAGLEFLTSGL